MHWSSLYPPVGLLSCTPSHKEVKLHAFAISSSSRYATFFYLEIHPMAISAIVNQLFDYLGQRGTTVNSKSFEGEKFCSLLGSSGTWEKFHSFFPSPPSYIHGFPNHTSNFSKQLQMFQLKFHDQLSLKTFISILGNGREYVATCVCKLHVFQGDHAVKSYSWSESEMKQMASCFHVSFFCKLLPNFLA